ncbi:ABC transporter ATP-binding protein [Sporosarcina sp. Te-1]|uniref:ABC transporter ATP-binding protein n=1 Tax=Sporosarcina sp. Te-1 TaxID=2818390 RepID=UPI001A9D7342|nr:ABC transporter ATP-binding protein [Sporosarcina sp. Te-1]QTD40079.1 ABC transporter ATP-binding protein [Sporosarcina sp. Te-1]
MRLEISDITKTFKTKKAVNQFSLTIEKGECVGLIGPNGAGKSTLIQIIADILEADHGEIRLDGKPIATMKREIGYLPQYPNFYHWMTAAETLFFMGELSGLTRHELKRDIPDILTRVGLAGEEDSKVGTFSGGMKQRLGIAQALLHKPSFILMDEPVSALDPIGRREVLNLIQAIKEETTVLFSTHILNDAEEICERFVVIKNGEKIEDTTKNGLLNRNRDVAIQMMIGTGNNSWWEHVKQLPYVQKVKVFGNKAQIYVNNIELDKNKLLGEALQHHIDIRNFEVGGSETIEEIFLDLVVGV